jgi:chorismate mutase
LQGVDSLSETSRYFVVESSVLPIVFSKVVKAKQLLANKKAKSATQASQMAGISRSVFYKYKDFVHPFYENGEKKITIYSLLEDGSLTLAKLKNTIKALKKGYFFVKFSI